MKGSRVSCTKYLRTKSNKINSINIYKNTKYQILDYDSDLVTSEVFVSVLLDETDCSSLLGVPEESK